MKVKELRKLLNEIATLDPNADIIVALDATPGPNSPNVNDDTGEIRFEVKDFVIEDFPGALCGHQVVLTSYWVGP